MKQMKCLPWMLTIITPENVDSSFVDLNSTLLIIKTGKLPVSIKITKWKQKRASATHTLKMKLEHTYVVQLDSSDSENDQCSRNLNSPFTIYRTMKEFGAKNYLMKKCHDVNNDGYKVQHQKQLILLNLEELYSSWKESYPEKKIGFSLFPFASEMVCSCWIIRN